MNKAETLKKISSRDEQLIRDVLMAGANCGNYYHAMHHRRESRIWCWSCRRVAREIIRLMRGRIAS